MRQLINPITAVCGLIVIVLLIILIVRIRIKTAERKAYLEAERKRREKEAKFYDFLDGAGAFFEGVWEAVTFWRHFLK